jgi:hypothetical protein
VTVTEPTATVAAVELHRLQAVDRRARQCVAMCTVDLDQAQAGTLDVPADQIAYAGAMLDYVLHGE